MDLLEGEVYQSETTEGGVGKKAFEVVTMMMKLGQAGDDESNVFGEHGHFVVAGDR